MEGNYTYIASAGDNQVVTASKCILKRIIVGKDVAGSVIEISDDTADGDVTLISKIEGSTLKGVYEFNVCCKKGLTLDLTNQTGVTVVWVPSA